MLNPYESPHLAVSEKAAVPTKPTGRPVLHAVVRLQTAGVVGLGLMSLADSGGYGHLPDWLWMMTALALAIPIAVAGALIFLGPFLWLGMVFGVVSPGQRSPVWFVLLEPILWGATLFALLPAVQ